MRNRTERKKERRKKERADGWWCLGGGKYPCCSRFSRRLERKRDSIEGKGFVLGKGESEGRIRINPPSTDLAGTTLQAGHEYWSAPFCRPAHRPTLTHNAISLHQDLSSFSSPSPLPLLSSSVSPFSCNLVSCRVGPRDPANNQLYLRQTLSWRDLVMPGTTHCYATIIVWNGNPPSPLLADLLNLILYRSSNDREGKERQTHVVSRETMRDVVIDYSTGIFQIPLFESLPLDDTRYTTVVSRSHRSPVYPVRRVNSTLSPRNFKRTIRVRAERFLTLRELPWQQW